MIHVRVHLDRGDFALDVDVQTRSRVTGLFGASGAGKSALISLIAGLERPSHGTIVVDGDVLFDSVGAHSRRPVDVPACRRCIGVVFQEHRLFPHLSVKSNLMYGRAKRLRGDSEAGMIIDLLELGPLLGRRATQLSGGEGQRVALGRAVLSRPRLLLLDEPLASLDARLKQQIIPYLQRLRDVTTVPMIYVSHDLGEILQLTDHLLILDRGRMVGHGRFTDLVHDDAALAVVHERGLRNVLAARVLQHIPGDGVSVVQIGKTTDPGRRLIVPRIEAGEGQTVMLSIQPWDVALAAESVHAVSIQNQIPGTVTRATMHERSAIVEVDAGESLIVEVSKRSAAALKIAAGQPIVCLIKANAIRQINRP
ncbi:MAG: molybdenum ABC transporter ATP-binding protein [Phycisphaerales bacterium]|nr:molybdenum ABC transporter ATP-binding protein [Phycisphaerales bacterium]